MGFFSWVTSDTNESIACTASSRETKTVYLLQPNGAEPIPCSAYEGYGKWGDGEDQVNIYEWLAVLNFGDAKYEREAIHADCENKKRLKYPLKFVSNPALKYEDVAASESCQYQGFFYPDEYSEIS